MAEQFTALVEHCGLVMAPDECDRLVQEGEAILADAAVAFARQAEDRDVGESAKREAEGARVAAEAAAATGDLPPATCASSCRISSSRAAWRLR